MNKNTREMARQRKISINAARGDALHYYSGDRYDIPYNQKNGIARHNYSTEREFSLSDQLYLFAELPAVNSPRLLDDLVD